MPWRSGAAHFPDLSSSGDADCRAWRSSGVGACRHRARLCHRPPVLLCHGTDRGVRLSAAAGDRCRFRHGDVVPVCPVAAGQSRGSARGQPVQEAERNSRRASARTLSGDRGLGASGACRTGACCHTRLAADTGLHWRLISRDRASCRSWRDAADRAAAASGAALCAGAPRTVGHYPARIAGPRHCHRVRTRPVGSCHGGSFTGQYRATDRQPCRR